MIKIEIKTKLNFKILKRIKIITFARSPILAVGKLGTYVTIITLLFVPSLVLPISGLVLRQTTNCIENKTKLQKRVGQWMIQFSQKHAIQYIGSLISYLIHFFALQET